MRIDDPHNINRRVEEKEIAKISKHIGELDFVGLQLGFSRGQIDQCKMYSPHSPAQQANKLLQDWRAKEYNRATVGSFIAKLIAAGVAADDLELVFTREQINAANPNNQ